MGHVLLSGDPLVGARAPRRGSPVTEVVVADINQALTLALAGVPASAVQGGVAQGAVGFSVLASAVRTAKWEEEPVSEVNSKAGIRHGLASGVWRGRLQKGPGASAAIALKVTGVILGEETVPNGKTWYVCSEKSDDPNMDCSPVDGWGNPTLSANRGEWLCKQETPRSERKPWNFWKKTDE